MVNFYENSYMLKYYIQDWAKYKTYTQINSQKSIIEYSLYPYNT